MARHGVYDSTDDGVKFLFGGKLFIPNIGTAPYPAAVISHGKGGMPGMPADTAKTFQSWGQVVIAPRYTHALDDTGGYPQGEDGASDANVARGKKAHDLLTCLSVRVDLSRVAAHGHSKGAYLNGQLVGSYPGDYRVASHTAGGVTTGVAGTKAAVARLITTPYQWHHSIADCTVLYRYDVDFANIVRDAGTEVDTYQYFYDAGQPNCPTPPSGADIDHALMQTEPLMYQRVHDWYVNHGQL